MTISYVSGATAESTSLTMPSHQSGDLLLMFAYNSGSSTRPTIPSGWTPVAGRSGNSQAGVVCYKIAASSAETCGTWTSATLLACAVYRHSTNLLLAGGWNAAVSAASTNINFAVITPYSSIGTTPVMFRTQSGNAWVVGFAGVVANNSDIETPPTLMTNRLNLAGSGAREISVHDTNADVTSWALATFIQSVSAASLTIVVEIHDSGRAKTSSGLKLTRPMNGGYNA
jgi:hypothetical protein